MAFKQKKKAQSSCILRNWSQSCYKWKGLFESINKNKLYLRRVVSTMKTSKRKEKCFHTVLSKMYSYIFFQEVSDNKIKDNLCTEESFVNQVRL